MRLRDKVLNGVILFLVIVIAIQSFIWNLHECEVVECPEFDTVAFLATIPVEYKDTTIYVPVHDTVYNDTGSVVLIPQDIDSLAVATAYFSEIIVIDTILNDSNGIIVINDTISRNRIKSRQIKPKTLYPSYKIITKTIKEPCVERVKLYAGMSAIGSMNRFGIAPSILLETRKGIIYGASYDLINKDVIVSVYWKIKFKK